MDTASVLVTIALSAILIVLGGSMVRSSTDLILVYLLVFAQFYWLRPVLFATGLDTPSPSSEFFSDTVPGLVTTTTVGLSLFLLTTLLTAGLYLRTELPGWGPCFTRGSVHLGRLRLVVLTLTGAAAVVSAYLVVSHGGVGALVTAAKFDKALAGLFVLRVIPSIGAVAALGGFLEAHSRRASAGLRWLMLACAVANAGFVFLWGSRSLLVVLGAVVVLGLRRNQATRAEAGDSAQDRARDLDPDQDSSQPAAVEPIEPATPLPEPVRQAAPRRKVVGRLVLATVMVVVAAGGLRVARDNLMHGEVLDVYADASMWRQLSLATNATYYDAAMLSFRDWPSEHDYRNGYDFVTGLVAFVPRVLWAGKPDSIAPGRWFRQVYQPDKVNGWPMGAAGLWYLNFGWLGLILGGLLSGLLLGALAKAQRLRPDNGLNTAVAVMVGVFVVGIGWDSDTLLRLLIWVGPLWVIARYVSPGPAPDSSSPMTLPAPLSRAGQSK